MAMVLEGPRLGGYKGTFTMDNLDGDLLRKKGTNDEIDKEDSGISTISSRPVSALARGVQITEFAESRVNPTPLLLEESDILLEQYLSPGKLQLLTGVDNLDTVESLELKVDSRETSLGNFGSLLPNLRELKLSGSTISCVRDLGSSLRKLRVLWLTRCGLEELDGISSMLNLAELYLEYNEVSDLSPLSMLEHLEILDLEGNNIDDVTQIQYLSLCPRLRRLALDGNPVCVAPSVDHDEPGYDYRQTIKKMLPNLLVLDDERLDEAPSSLSKHNVFDDDWAYLEELQQDALLQGDFEGEEGASGAEQQGDRPTTAALRPATGYRPGSALRPSSGFRPLSASRRPSTMSPNTPNKPGTPAALRPVSSDAVEGLESTSELTIGGVICGNPSKALRQRRQGGPGSKEDIRHGLNKLMQKGAVFTHSEDAEDVPLKAEDEMNNIIEELQSWKVEHEKRMEVIKKSKEAQVLVVDHDEAEDVDMSGSDVDSDLELPGEEHRPMSSQKRHSADLRLKANKGKPMPAKPKPPVVESPSPRSPRVDSPRSKRPQGMAVRQHDSFNMADSRLRDDFSHGGTDFEYGDPLSRPLSAASISSYQRPSSRERGLGDSRLDWEGDSDHRPRSRGQGEPSLGPLRAPSPTSAQIINSLRQRHQDLPPTPTSARSKKLRIGPTGLPNSSQQPVIKNSLVPPPSRSGLVPGPGVRPSSRSSVPLLPSQPRIARQLPETPSLFPHPPNKS